MKQYDTRIIFCVTAKQREKIKKDAHKAQMRMAEYIRSKLGI